MDQCTVDEVGKLKRTHKQCVTVTLAMWNVRTMLQAGNMAEIAEEVLRHGLGG